jgi:hypothetical protein
MQLRNVSPSKACTLDLASEPERCVSPEPLNQNVAMGGGARLALETFMEFY